MDRLAIHSAQTGLLYNVLHTVFPFLSRICMNSRFVIAAVLLITAGVASYFIADYYRTIPDQYQAKYVGRDSCIECHQQQVDLFHGSDHDLAMDLANETTVLGNFDDQELEHYGITSRMYKDGKRFMVETDGPDGKLQQFEVKYVFGVRPLQQYMVEIKRPANAASNEIGRVQVLRISWDTEKEEWFYLMPPDVDERLQPDDPLHWTGITQNWNTSCAPCHSTDVHKNFSLTDFHYRTTFSEIDVSCEACHGPASYHIELANRASPFWDRKHGYGLAKLKTESNRAQVESCAPCHSRRTMTDESFRPGCNFDDYFATQLIMDPIYHVDGQVRDEDYVYGSFIQSKMYHKNIRCTDCHDPHTSKLKHQGNLLCTSCHQNQHPAGKYDTPNHHHHEPGQPGSFCVDCHMPSTTYMMVDHRRDHSFRVPRPDLSIEFGTPNACTGCHLKKEKLGDHTTVLPLRQYLDWLTVAERGDEVVSRELNRVNQLMQTAVEKWYDTPPEIERTKYYQQIAKALTENGSNAKTLKELAKDSSAPAILRASAAAGLARQPDRESFSVAREALEDPDPKVVAAALMRVDTQIGMVSQQLSFRDENEIKSAFGPIARAVAPLLGHDSRRVRTEAARVFTSLPEVARLATPRQLSDYDRALDELKSALMVDNDRSNAHMMLADILEMQQDLKGARRHYELAVKVEPNVSGPRANLCASLEREIEQIRNRLTAMQRGGANGQVNALELKRLFETMNANREQIKTLRLQEHNLLKKDLELSKNLPNTHGLHYRYAMSAYLQGDMKQTEKHLKIAHQQLPNNQRYLLGLATYYVQVNQPDEAMKFINSLLVIEPNNVEFKNLRQQAISMKAENQ